MNAGYPRTTVSATMIHIEPRRGAWVVRDDMERDPVSEHGDCTAATNAAREHARRFRDVTVLLHDRYGRVRPVVSSSDSARRFSRASAS